MAQRKYFATCARGLEEVLAAELRALHSRDVNAGKGGVHFSGDLSLLYRANLWLRTAVRVLQPVLETTVTSPEELYDAVRSIDWLQYLTPNHTLAVDCNVRDSAITHSKYAALKTKDAICDQFLDKIGRRPSVDTETPLVGLNLHIHANQAVLSLESSGESLHKRGYRTLLHRASLNEALASGLILLSGWKPEDSFFDPLCGSGTLPIETMWMALRRPPGLTRKRFGFQSWMDFDRELWIRIRDEARGRVRKDLPATIGGSDNRRDVLRIAENNARAAGCGHLLQFHFCDIAEMNLPTGKPGTILCNPPYGERIGEEKELRALYKKIGEVFRNQCAGWKTWLFTGNGRLARSVDLPVKQRIHLFNGRIPCQLLQYGNSEA